MYTILSKSQLFKGLAPEEITPLFSDLNYTIKQYSQDDVVVLKGANYSHMMILTEGNLICELTLRDGRESKIESLSAPALLLPAILFSAQKKIPVNIIADGAVTVLLIDKSDFCNLLSLNTIVLENFLGIVSDNNKPLSDKMMFLGFKNIKSKFANLLLEQSTEEKSMTFRLKQPQREMAEMFGVTRPALARTIGEMAAEGAIYVDRKNITILYPEKLKQYAAK